MKYGVLIIVLICFFSCSQKEQKKEVDVRTDFQTELLRIIQKDTFDQVTIYNNLTFRELMGSLSKNMNNQLGNSYSIDRICSFQHFYLIRNRIISIIFDCYHINNSLISEIRRMKRYDSKLILPMIANVVPDTIYIENMNCPRYYQYRTISNLEDSVLYDIVIPDSSKDKLGLPRDFKSALPILSDTNIFK